VAKPLEVSEASYHRWRAQCGGLKADDVRRLKELEGENARLKRIVADKELQLQALTELGGGTGEPGPPASRRHSPAAGVGVSQGWACRLVGQHRSTQRHQPIQPDRDRALCEALRRLSRAHPRWGYRRAHAQLCSQGWRVNRTAIHHLWREEGLRVPARRRNANASVSRPVRPTGWRPSTLAMCGPWTTSSTRPPMAESSSC
jgi:HTH-like domain/Transposase